MRHSTCDAAIVLTNQVRRTCQFMDGTVPKAAQRSTPRACSRVEFLGERMAITGSEVIPVACLRAPLRNTKSWMPNDFPLPGREAITCQKLLCQACRKTPCNRCSKAVSRKSFCG